MFPSLYYPLLVVMPWILTRILTRIFLTNLDTPHLTTPSLFSIVPPPSYPHDLLSPPPPAAAAAAAAELKRQILVLRELITILYLLEHVRKKYGKSRKLGLELGLGIRLKHLS